MRTKEDILQENYVRPDEYHTSSQRLADLFLEVLIDIRDLMKPEVTFKVHEPRKTNPSKKRI